MKRIRRGSTAVEVYNEGLVVFLYDEANREAIQEADPSILGGFSADDVEDPALADLASKGMLVAYQLMQDDDVSIEVIVGSPLTDKELNKGHWLAAQRAPLSLPSGRLHIEGYNSLELSPDHASAERSEPVVSVASGDYVLSLHRVDRDAVQDWNGPSEVIVLTNAQDAQPVANPAPLLVAQAPPPLAEWVGAYEIRRGQFMGLIRFLSEGDMFDMNVSPEAAQDLGLKPGAIFHITVERPAVQCEGVYLGENLQSANAVREAIRRVNKPDLWEAQWMRSDDRSSDYLFFQPVDATLNVAPHDRNRWIRVTVDLPPSVLQD